MPDFEFECPHCGERTVVDEAARRLLVANGCLVCGEVVTWSAFRRERAA
jgi:rRNA maturation protein Nop10